MLAREYNIHFFETSAKQDMNVEKSFITIATDVKERLMVDGGSSGATAGDSCVLTFMLITTQDFLHYSQRVPVRYRHILIDIDKRSLIVLIIDHSYRIIGVVKLPPGGGAAPPSKSGCCK